MILMRKKRKKLSVPLMKINTWYDSFTQALYEPHDMNISKPKYSHYFCAKHNLLWNTLLSWLCDSRDSCDTFWLSIRFAIELGSALLLLLNSSSAHPVKVLKRVQHILQYDTSQTERNWLRWTKQFPPCKVILPIFTSGLVVFNRINKIILYRISILG